ncbi:MAG: serine protease [Acidobacteriia bacterium]|nr:serine protease [Terriglobia bacterium]
MVWRQSIFAVLICWLLCDAAFSQTPATQAATPLALRAAVPLLCTENNRAAHTRVRGSGVIADSGGTLLTAAHVILQARFDCTLSVMIPDEEWTRSGRLRAFLVGDCHLNQPLDLAVCRIHPAENSRDWGYLRAARIRLRPATSGELVWVTAFTGWGLLPLTRSGHITGRQDYQRQDGCRCDFATDITAVEGMSGSPVISGEGEVLGILTLAGKEKFRGFSFGVSFDEARSFLKAEGVIASAGLVDHVPGKQVRLSDLR